MRALAGRMREGLVRTVSDASAREVALWWLFALALCVRLAVIAGTIGLDTPAALEPAADSRIHIALVHSLLGGHGFSLAGVPTAITPPLYISVLAGVYRLTGDPAAVRILQAILGALGCIVIYDIGRRMFDACTGLAAGVLLALSPLPAYLAGLHLTETLFLCLLLLVLWQALRVTERPTVANAAALGGLVGLAALTRAVFLAFPPFLLPWAVAVWGGRQPASYRVAAVAAAGAALVILPWTIRNYVVLRAVVPVQSNGGLVFWAGNNPSADGGLVWPTGRTWTARPAPDDGFYGWRGLTVAEDNRRYVRAAAAWIRAHPGAYARLLGRKLVRLYGFTRSADRRDVHVPLALALTQASFMALALAGLCLTARRWRAVSLLLVLIGFTNIVVLLFSGGTRYTIPMVPSLVLLAAVALVAAVNRALQAAGLDRLPVESRA